METHLRSLVSSVNLDKSDTLTSTDDGTIFKKQLFTFGTWINPDWWWDEVMTMELDTAFAQSLIDNFNANTLGSKVAVPLNHTGDVKANTGELTRLETDGEGLNGYLLVKDQVAVDKIRNGLIFDVSIGFDWDYVSQKDGKHFGPTLYHVALVTEPYINNMSGFVETELSKRHDEYAANVGFGKERESVIMFSKDRVKEIQNAMKFAKVKNDKSYEVEVKYTEDGKEVVKTVAAGEEFEVPTEVSDAVSIQIADAVEPQPVGGDPKPDDGDAEPDGGKPKDGEDPNPNPPTPDPKEGEETELAKANRKIAELESEKVYDELLSKGKITPAQKDMFFALAKESTVTLAKEFKGLKLAKGEKPSMTTLLSAIFEAGPQYVKLGEKGSNGGEGDQAKLTPEEEELVKAKGFSIEKFNKQLAKGTITMDDIRGEK